MSIRMTGENNFIYGKFGPDHPSFGFKKTPEQLDAISGENSHMFGKTGPDHPAFGYKFTPEQLDAISGENSHMFGKTGPDHPAFGYKFTPEQLDAISGENSHMFGKTGPDHPAYGIRWSKTPEQTAKTSGQNNYRAKPVSVFGKVYPCAQNASDKLRSKHAPNRADSFIARWVHTKKHQSYVFYVSKEFYTHATENHLTNVTRDSYEKWAKTNNY
jgi:hypothetical protein